MGKEAVKIGANTFQFFTRNPRGAKAKQLDLADVEQYLEFAKEHRSSSKLLPISVPFPAMVSNNIVVSCPCSFIDQVIGIKRLMAIHLNDSKNPLGSHKDRHEKIGEGEIGLAAFVLNAIPFPI